MLEIIYQITSIITNTVVLSIVGYVIFQVQKIKNKLNKMDAEELLKNSEGDFENNEVDETKRERLSAIVAGGGSKQYLGKDLQLSDIDTMTSEQINKLYCRYEARLGASMTKTLGNSFINVFVLGLSRYFKVNNPPKLIQNLEEDVFTNHALTSACCELYYRYGIYLAPFTALLITLRHIDFQAEKTENINLENDE